MTRHACSAACASGSRSFGQGVIKPRHETLSTSHSPALEIAAVLVTGFLGHQCASFKVTMLSWMGTLHGGGHNGRPAHATALLTSLQQHSCTDEASLRRRACGVHAEDMCEEASMTRPFAQRRTRVTRRRARAQVTTNTAGMLAAVAAIVCTAVYQIWAGSKQKELGAGSMQLMHQFQPHATGLLALLVLGVEPLGLPGMPHALGQGTILGYQYTPLAVAAILASAVLGLLVSLSTFLVIGATSSVTFNVVCSDAPRKHSLQRREPGDQGCRSCGSQSQGWQRMRAGGPPEDGHHPRGRLPDLQ